MTATGIRVFARVLILRPGPRFLAVASRVRDGIVWNLPGGKLDPGESPLDAAIRETAEEIGVVCPRQAVFHLCDVDVDFFGVPWRGHFFVYRGPAEPRIAAPREIREFRWVDAAQAALLPARREVFDEVFLRAIAGR
jgi:8-oxo-dGTP pyrophosphatase MutT (NUDIX family)